MLAGLLTPQVEIKMSKLMRGGIAGIFVRWASRLRFPYLFCLTAVLFVLNLFIPDALPLADELLMGLGALLLASLRKKPEDSASESTNDTEVQQSKESSR